MTVGYKQLIEEARAEIENLPAADALTVHGDAETVFVDIRDVRELEREGMIPDAFSAPRGMLEFWFDPESPYHKDIFSSGKRLVFYCASGWRSALATQTAQKMGLKNVCHIDGGFTAWKEAGGEVAERKRK
ncbi:MAG: rhodanese-like domain-containing protein [Alphaproteobacteria bacterium]|nr:rhodanese-like domain-containing protein [Alphaproteobacteria bacterium]